jgi:hypothetical protein
MIPNVHIHERLMFERCQERQHAVVQQRLATGLRREHSRVPRRLLAHIGGFLIKSGSSLKQLVVRERQVTYDH